MGKEVRAVLIDFDHKPLARVEQLDRPTSGDREVDGTRPVCRSKQSKEALQSCNGESRIVNSEE